MTRSVASEVLTGERTEEEKKAAKKATIKIIVPVISFLLIGNLVNELFFLIFPNFRLFCIMPP